MRCPRTPSATFAITIFLSLAIPAPYLQAGEQLLYFLTYHQSLGMMTTHNRLFSFNPDTKETKLLFTDEHTPIVLTLPAGPEEGEYGRKAFVSSKKKVFAPGRERGRSGEKPRIYELSVDGSNRFRALDLADIKDNVLAQVFVNPAGTLVGYISEGGTRAQTVVIHEPATGRLVHRVSLQKRFLGNIVRSTGWMPDATKLYFTLYAYEPEAPDEAYKKLGTYLMNADGTGLVRLPPSLFAFPKPQGFTAVHSVGAAPDCVGVQSDGTLLMRELYSKGGLHSFLYLVNPATKSKKPVPLSRSEKIDWFRLSHNGKRVAFMQVESTPPQPYHILTFDIWVKDLESGAEQRVGSIRTGMGDDYWPTLVGWLE